MNILKLILIFLLLSLLVANPNYSQVLTLTLDEGKKSVNATPDAELGNLKGTKPRVFDQIPDLSKLKSIVIKLPSDWEDEKLTFQIEKNDEGTFSDITISEGQIRFTELPLTNEINNIVLIVNNQNATLINNKITFSIKEEAVEETEPANCYFYTREMLKVKISPTSRRNKKPYYVISYNFEDANQGPVIYRHSSKMVNNETNDTIKVKRNLWVGRNSSFTFLGMGYDFDRFSHSFTFKDYNQEDGEIFSSFVSNGILGQNVAKNGSTSDQVEVTEQKNQDEQLLQLDRELSYFLEDSENNLILPNQYKSILLSIKNNIEKCFTEGLMDSGKFIEQFSEDFDKETAKIVLHKLFLLESMVTIKHPPFKIKNYDALISKLEYFNNDNAVYENYPDKEIPILGGFKVDFSTGVLGSNLVDKTFFTQNADSRVDSIVIADNEIRLDTIAMKQIVRENTDQFQIGFGVLAHFYPRLTPYVNVSFTTGFIVRDNLAFQFPVGFSALVGRQSRLIISYGLTFGQTKVLSARYLEGEPIESSELVNVDDSQYTILQSNRGHFIGLTYNFARIRLND